MNVFRLVVVFKPVPCINLELHAAGFQETAQPEWDGYSVYDELEIRHLQPKHECDVHRSENGGSQSACYADDGALAHFRKVLRLVFADVFVDSYRKHADYSFLVMKNRNPRKPPSRTAHGNLSSSVSVT